MSHYYSFIVHFLSFFLLLTTLPCHRFLTEAAGTGGRWELLQENIGITAMHMQLLHNDRVVIFDRTDFGRSNLSLPNGKCREDPTELVLKTDCTAHSVEYDVLTNTFRPLMVQTNVWCSSGAVMPDGRLIQTGGFNDGERKVRVFNPCSTCDWKEVGDGLKARRWYATNQILPDGKQIIIGGRRQFNYEFYPKTSAPDVYSLPFLVQTNDRGIENNLYPFVFLNTDGNLFIFSNNRAILFDYKVAKVVKTYPTIPGGDPRCYPSTGSAVLLPLKNLQQPDIEAEVLICGGAPKGSYTEAGKGNFVKALDTCGRIKITDANPQWSIETMPQARVMGDMILLPNGDVLIVNGAGEGTAGWEYGRTPVLSPVIYKPNNAVKSRFEEQNPSAIPRMYHSTAILLRNGRILVGGSNPHINYEFGNDVMFPTELRLEAFYPPYLDTVKNNLRPKIISPTSNKASIGYNEKLVIRFKVTDTVIPNTVSVTMVAPSFTTHSFSMNQRLLVLGNEKVTNVETTSYDVEVITPRSSNLAPSGFYLLFVVHQGIPSEGIWVQIK
ncbi:aldehyde oxidase GLOX [Mercurialis annua]|uniref:aldehyde oxidase GLOX n=1 Tax=Mercurialis annua TaxID=3986 RepID=UPI00216106DA|nr:aldehyde oxidase GLOX [Mercurialis annua]